jgi:ABC-type polysaccharide/polyol phosphate export permease
VVIFVIREALTFEISYWKRWKLNFIGSYLDSLGLLFAIIMLIRFRSGGQPLSSIDYSFFIIGFLSSYLVRSMFERMETPKNYAKYDIYDWISSSKTSMFYILIAERIWVFLRSVTPGIIGMVVYFVYLSVPLTVLVASIGIMVLGWLGCVGVNLILTSVGLLYGKIEGVSGWLSLLLSYFLIGIFFPVKMLPMHLWVVSLIFPPTYTIDITRHLVLSSELILGSFFVEVICLIILNSVLLTTGVILFKKADKRVREGGLQF